LGSDGDTSSSLPFVAVFTVRREAQDKRTFARDSSFTSNDVNAGDL
jgi:hypothetical protein